ncbi:MAG: hypothetical protein D6786_03985 [Gammaproteobacteria bacterium]|nr:MAG: hypothetical protein D6786_03985 [Gammaproteobacteria bacterium]
MKAWFLLMPLLLTLPAAAATPPSGTPGSDFPLQATTRGPANGAGFWLELRKGATGTVAGPASQPRFLIREIPRDCTENDSCTEQAVGFSLNVHDLMPPIFVPIGTGPTPATLGFVVLLFGGLLLAGARFVRRLGQDRPDAD